MKKRIIVSIILAVNIYFSLNCFSQSLVPVGNPNFPINDNTSSAPVAAINPGWEINGMGKIIKIVPHPTILSTLYACSGSGGIFVSTNSGALWTSLSGSFSPGVQFGSLAIDPTNPAVMYAGTGEPTFAQTYGWSGYGVFKTLDGGSTWSISNAGMGNVVVLDLLINSANSLIVVACTTNGIYKSINGGQNWVAVLSAQGQWLQQVVRQGTGNNLLAVSNSKFYRSTDFGDTWLISDLDPAFSTTFANGRVAVAPSNPNIVYAGWVNNTFSYCNNASLYCSIDGGITFTKKYAFSDPVKLLSYDGAGTRGYGWANFFITVSLNDPYSLWSGGHIIFKSTNSGSSWSPTVTPWYCCLHTDIHQLLYDPNNSNRFFAANDGGIFVSTDQALSWNPSSNGLACSQFESMGQSNVDSNFVIGGLQDNGIIYNNSDGNYHTYTGGDPTDHMTCDYTNTYNVYTTHSGGKVFNPYNRSQSANLNLPNSLASGSRQSFFISALNPSTAFGWGSNVWRSSNVNNYNLAAGTSSVAWTQISAFGLPIQDVKTSPASDDIVYALSNNATIYKSVNATSGSPTFSLISLPPGASSSINGSLTVSTLNPNVIYTTANNAVYRSTDAGTTWNNYTATGLPGINLQKIFLDPYSTIEGTYVITTLGLFYRDLTMTSWASVNPQVVSGAQNTDANFAGLINGASLFKGSGSSSSHISFSTWGSGIWKAKFYTQQNNPLPGMWSTIDIGSPSINGGGHYDNVKHTFNLSGSGSGINAISNDQFSFTKVPLTGNSDLTTRVYSVADADPATGLSKTGLMLRTNSSSNSPYVMIAQSGHSGVFFQYRLNSGENATVMPVSLNSNASMPLWLRLSKNVLNVITAYVSPDGTTWTQVGQVTLNLGSNFLGGVANTSNSVSNTNRSATSDIILNNFGVLAIENLQIHASLTSQNKVNLSWSFTTEDYTNTLTLERSQNGITFNSLIEKTYTHSGGGSQSISDKFTDNNAVPGLNYYRIKSIMPDGTVKYSNIDHISLKPGLVITVEPNPVPRDGVLKIKLSGYIPTTQINIDIFDVIGRKILSKSGILSRDVNIPLENFQPGTYIYKVNYDNMIISGKIVISN